MATSKQIVDQIRPGDTVTFRDRFGKACKGKAVMFGPSGWVLNMGGKYGTPAVVNESKIEKVTRSRSAASGYASRALGKQNPYKHPGAVSFDSLGIGERFKFAPWGPGPIDRTSHTVYTKTSARGYTDGKYSLRVGSVKTTVERYGKQNPAGYIDSFGRFRPIRSGTRYGNYKGKRMQWQDATPYDDVKATGGYKSSWSAKLKAATKKAKKSTGAAKSKKRNPETRARFKIIGMPSETQYHSLPFGRKIEYNSIIQAFKKRAQHGYLDAKGMSVPTALAKFKKLYKPNEWYLIDRTGPDFKDDSMEIWFA